VSLISKFVQEDSGAGDEAAKSNIQILNPDELPQNAVLLFSLKAETPENFSRAEEIEVATKDGAYSTTLTLADGLTLQDRHIAVARLDPAKAFGSSAFGPLRFRVVADGVNGDWQPLGTLVRLPNFESLKCDDDPDVACKLRGSNLFLVDSIAPNQQFTNPVQVPDGFPGRVLPVPHPMDGGELYVKLRDDPSVVNVVTLTAEISGGKKPTEKQEAVAPKPRPTYTAPATQASQPVTNPTPVAPAKIAPAPGSDASRPERATPATHAAAPSATDAPAAAQPKAVSNPSPAVDASHPTGSQASAPVSSSEPEQKPATSSSSAPAQK